MPTTYRTKDGIVLQNVPDGTPEDQVKARIAAIRSQRGGAAAPAAPARFDAVPTVFGNSGAPEYIPEVERAKKQNLPQSVGGAVAAFGRDLAMAPATLAALPVDMGTRLYNVLAGENLRTPTEAANQSLNAMGVPENPLVISMVNQGLAGAKLPIPGLPPAPKNQPPLQSAAQRRAGRAVREVAGDDMQRAALSETLRNYRPSVEGVRPTVAEAVKGTPEGVPMQRLQQTVAGVTGEPYGSQATEFTRRAMQNQSARDAATETLGATHGAKREAILEKANQFSDRLRNLTAFIADRTARADKNLQLKGKMDTAAAVDTRRSLYRDAPAGPIARKLGLADDAVPYPSQGAGATPRPPQKYTQHYANATSAKGAAEEAEWAMDVRRLEAAGAELEKDLLDNTGLVALGPESLVAGAKGKATDPRVYANEIASKTYQAFVDDVARITGKDGSIDARALDEVRKSFGPKLTMLFEKEGWNVKDAAFVRAMRSAQGFIDDAIEAAGGTGYKDELARYSEGIQSIKDDALRADEMYKTNGPVSVPLANLIDRQTMSAADDIPGFFSWKVTAGKHLLRALRKQAEPAVVGEIGKLLRSPDDMAWALDKRNEQKATEALQRALLKYGRRVPAAAGSSRKE